NENTSISEYNQQAGMVGLGVGARSFTTDLHYTTDYAVVGGLLLLGGLVAVSVPGRRRTAVREERRPEPVGR
ncbi:hypothetical protein EAO70_37350, partial [Streptomyces sp. adm13(2018)]|uniref:hypothetical protein n=1 Tax=Streptomyces sp. adm13(2018) TaxID=2479007 RepID=UPI0011CE00EA